MAQAAELPPLTWETPGSSLGQSWLLWAFAKLTMGRKIDLCFSCSLFNFQTNKQKGFFFFNLFFYVKRPRMLNKDHSQRRYQRNKGRTPETDWRELFSGIQVEYVIDFCGAVREMRRTCCHWFLHIHGWHLSGKHQERMERYSTSPKRKKNILLNPSTLLSESHINKSLPGRAKCKEFVTTWPAL